MSRRQEEQRAYRFSCFLFLPPASCLMIAAILLAAGRSSRMGAFKPLLPFGDKSVVEACVDNLRKGGVGTTVVVIGQSGDRVRERLKGVPVRFAVNAEAESEMGVSVARGVEQIPHGVEAVFIALVDQPAVPPEVISLLIEERRRSSARLVQPEYEGRGGHPVLIDLSFRQELLSLDPQHGLRGLFENHREEVLRVRIRSPFVARDMDTWDDYRALYLEVFGIEPPENSRQ
jgi:molybdenum cofactor cytidylyltransferase